MPKQKTEKSETQKLKPNQKANIFEWSKKRIETDSGKLNKIVLKLEKSIQNHEAELTDKKQSLEDCKNEIKQLQELLKEV
jgi:peptidoglycan hydrolase CwlO-like protein